MNRPLTRRSAGGFSLLEMIVVVAIILILLALLTPTLANVMERARLLQCSANLRGIHQAMQAFEEDHEGILVPTDVRPWRMVASYQEESPQPLLYRWNMSWPAILVKGGYVPKPPLTDDPSVMPPQGANIFYCPSGNYEVGNFSPPSMFDEGGKGAWMAKYAADDVAHGFEQHVSPTDYKFFPAWYGINGDTFYSDRWPYNRNPQDGGSVPRPPHLQTANRVQNPTAMVVAFDGIWIRNRVTGRINARHMRSTHTNMVMMDGSVRVFETASLPNPGSTDPTLYPRFRYGSY